ncbi:MAG: HAD-IC family P-type ATPase, partial [Pseudonocardia sp.]
MRLPTSLAAFSPVGALRVLRDTLLPGARPVWSGPGRLHVAVRGVPTDALDGFAADLGERVGAVPGVQWAGLDQGCGRLVVAAEGDVGEAVIAAVEAAEAAAGADGPFPTTVEDHPADRAGVARHALEAAADVAAVATAVTARALSLPARLLPIDPAPVLGLVASSERLRAPLEGVLGRPAVGTVLNIASAAVNGAEQRFVAPAVDLAHRVLLVRQEESRGATFDRLERRLYPQAPAGPAVAPPVHGRPVPLPPGPVERYVEQDLVATLAAAAATVPLSGRAQRASSVLSVGVPKAARLGREAFASGVVEYLGRCGVLVVAPRPVRLLDQVDRVVVDPAVLGELDDAVLAAAQEAGVEVLLLDPDDATPVPDRAGVVRAAEALAAVATLQKEGHVVALVAGPGEPALASADLGVAVARPPEPVPWHADLVAPDGPRALAALLGSAALARTISRHSVLLALAGTAASAITTFGLPRRGTTALVPPTVGVDIAALVALAHARMSTARLAVPKGPAVAPGEWHRLAAGEVLQRVGSSASGLDAAEAARRRPPVQAEPSVPAQLLAHLVEELRNPLTPVLAIGAGLSLAIGSVLDAAMVSAVVLADAAIGAVQQLRAERAIAALDRVAAQVVTVHRDGRVETVPAADLVVGDVVRLDTGEDVPADCRILEADHLETDESALTGESLPVPKSAEPTAAEALGDRVSMLYAGTAIAAGRATAVVVAVGADTVAGQAAATGAAPLTGVEKRLEALAARATPVALLAGGLTVAASLARGRPLAETLATGVSLTVAAVPEGLPILATAAQLAGGKRLARQGVLVRTVRSVEALGRVDTLCLDKTGTLTEGVLRLHAVHDGESLATVGRLDSSHRAVLETALTVSAATPADRRRPGSTDAAVVEAAKAAGIDAPPRPTAELAYESGRGFHAVAIGAEAAVVGAPETVLDRCVRDGDGPLDRDRLERVVDALAGDGGRVLAVAHRVLERAAADLPEDLGGLRFAGYLVLADPPRPDARRAVETLMSAGVHPVVVTGDHPATARWLAAEVGIIDGAREVLSGPDLDRLTDDELDAVLPDVAVCARVTPAHKARLVTAFRRLGHVVAMTGDGVNDAAAIRLADVGIALGGSSTAAARRAADVVLVDESIDGIVDAVVEGRALWVAVRDAVANLVGHNYGEIGVITGASLLTGTTPLTARQLLLVNLFTDTVPALT